MYYGITDWAFFFFLGVVHILKSFLMNTQSVQIYGASILMLLPQQLKMKN
jgi:hypothetical protein